MNPCPPINRGVKSRWLIRVDPTNQKAPEHHVLGAFNI